ncbi:MAG: PAS domain S-box protein [bacterium]
MNSQVNTRFNWWINACPRIAGGAAIITGLLVIVGWIFDIPILTSVHPDLLAMKANTAFAFILAGMSLLLHSVQREDKQRMTARLLACLVGLIGMLNVLQYAFAWDSGIDQLIFKETIMSPGTLYPGRMSFNTAIGFSLLGLALLIINRKIRRGNLSAQILALLAGLVGLLALLAYIFGLSEFSGYAAYTRMALHTATSFILLTVGVLCLQRDVGIISVLADDGSGGFMARRLMLAAVAAPLVMGWLVAKGENWGWYDFPFTDLISVAFNMTVLVLLVWIVGQSLNKVDRERKLAEQTSKHAEEMLQESELKFRTLFDNILDGILIADMETRRFYLGNKAICQMIGYTQDEIYHVGVNDIHPPEHLPYVLEQFNRQARREISLAEDIPIKRKDGSVFYADIKSTPVTLSGRIFIIGVFRDITERKLAEQARRESEAQYRLIVEHATDLIYTLDNRGNVIFVNSAISRLLGYSPDEIVGRRYLDFVRPDFQKRAERNFFTQWLRKTPFVYFEAPVLMKDGREVWLGQNVVLIFKNDDPVGFSAVSRDITENKKVIEILAERERTSKLNADIAALWNQNETLNTVLKKCAEAMVLHLDAAFARIWTLNREENVLELQASAGLYTHLNGPHRRVPVGSKSQVGLIAEERKPRVINSVIGDPLIGDQEWAVREGMVSFAGYPLIVEGQVLGVIAMFFRRPLSELILNTLELVVEKIAIGIERKRAEESLKQSVSLLQATLESTTDGILVVDRSGKITSYNTQFSEMWKVPDEVVASRDDDRALNCVLEQLKNPEAFISKVRELYAQPDASSYDVLDFKDGRIFERYSRPQRVDGKPVGRVWSFRNVTERERMEMVLIASELELRRVWEGSFDGMRVVDGEGTILMVNEAYCAMTGKGREELVGKPISIITVESQQQHILERHKQRFSSGTIEPRAEKQLELWDGRKIWFEVSNSPIEIEGQPKRILSIFRDVTVRKQAEIALGEAITEREKLIQELQSALDNIRTLQGLLPICSTCKKIRDDQGFWNQVEGYISKHTEVTFTHGICPECAKKLYGDLYEKASKDSS